MTPAEHQQLTKSYKRIERLLTKIDDVIAWAIAERDLLDKVVIDLEHSEDLSDEGNRALRVIKAIVEAIDQEQIDKMLANVSDNETPDLQAVLFNKTAEEQIEILKLYQ